MSPERNPLLEHNDLPRFDQIRPEHAQPALEIILAEAENALLQLESNVTPTWDGCLLPLRDLIEPLDFAWGVVTHLHSVMNTPDWRDAHDRLQPRVVAFYLRASQSKPIYRALEAIHEGADWDSLNTTRQRIVTSALLQAKLAGVGLPAQKQERFNAIKRDLAHASTQFTNNLLDATKSYSLVLKTSEDIAGLPPSLLAAASDAARQSGATESTSAAGPWTITLETPLYLPFMQYSERRDLRETLYRGFVSRASQEATDNTPIIDTIIALRREMSELLGYNTYAEISLARKMAKDIPAVDALIERLRAAARPAADRELDELREFVVQRKQDAPLMNWDVAYWSEQMREVKFGFTAEDLRPYFQFPRVLDALFALAQKLFGITIAQADGKEPVWHEDVRYFTVHTADGEQTASFYLDPYSRPETKRGGAWMNAAQTRTCLQDGTYRLPAAYLVCNQTLPVDGKPSLMTFNEVTTLYHEFGHALQHLLTTVDEPEAAGIHNVEWDAVELPSQFMENWCYHRPTLMGMSSHVETGEPLPDELYRKLCESRTFLAGSATMRQLLFGALDMELHHRYNPSDNGSPDTVKERIGEIYATLPFIDSDRFLCSFAHIFAGGYAAGYYSYKWAEVLSADAFAAFTEAGVDDISEIRKTGRRFRDTVLALGGSRHPMEVFRQFRGREPDPDALLRQDGLLA